MFLPLGVMGFSEIYDCDIQVIKLEFILRLKIKCDDWLLADTYPQADNHCTLFSV